MAGHKKPAAPDDPDNIEGPSFDELADLQAFQRNLPRLAAELRKKLLDADVPELTVEVLTDQLTAARQKWAFCPHCRQTVRAEMADPKSQLAAARMVLEYLLGKPKERKEVELVVSQKPLHEMTLGELRDAAAQLRA